MLHYTAMASAEAALDRLCDPAFEVSAHYLIGRCGTLWRLVPEDRRAWHAGRGRWGACSDLNSASIGIELDNSGDHPFAARQTAVLDALLADILPRRAIAPARVLAHSDIAPGRKIDPGPRFDWARLARLGLAVAARPGRGDVARLSSDLAAAGYTGHDDPDVLLSAFRLRHRPHATGPTDALDAGMAADLAARFPVDAPAAPA
ncbi:MAG: N-acetylmuramoyl-L-alanine amidase [Paracoccaceae bacterium]